MTNLLLKVNWVTLKFYNTIQLLLSEWNSLQQGYEHSNNLLLKAHDLHSNFDKTIKNILPAFRKQPSGRSFLYFSLPSIQKLFLFNPLPLIPTISIKRFYGIAWSTQYLKTKSYSKTFDNATRCSRACMLIPTWRKHENNYNGLYIANLLLKPL